MYLKYRQNCVMKMPSKSYFSYKLTFFPAIFQYPSQESKMGNEQGAQWGDGNYSPGNTDSGKYP